MKNRFYSGVVAGLSMALLFGAAMASGASGLWGGAVLALVLLAPVVVAAVADAKRNQPEPDILYGSIPGELRYYKQAWAVTCSRTKKTAVMFGTDREIAEIVLLNNGWLHTKEGWSYVGTTK